MYPRKMLGLEKSAEGKEKRKLKAIHICLENEVFTRHDENFLFVFQNAVEYEWLKLNNFLHTDYFYEDYGLQGQLI